MKWHKTQKSRQAKALSIKKVKKTMKHTHNRQHVLRHRFATLFLYLQACTGHPSSL